MAGKIARLTGAQLRELPSLRAQWLDIESLTTPADRTEAEAGVADAYTDAGLRPPRAVLWVEDPALGATAAAILAHYGDDTADQIWTRGRRRAKAEALRHYRGRVWAQARDALRFGTASPAETQTVLALYGVLQLGRAGAVGPFGRREPLGADDWGHRDLWRHHRLDYRGRGLALAQQTGPPPADPRAWFQVRRQWQRPEPWELRSVLDWAFGRRAQLEELALYEALSAFSESAVSGPAGLARVAKSAGWWWPFQDVAVLCEHPAFRELDREGRLHSENGPALAYRDGLRAYFWHGRLVPRWVVMEPSVKHIAAEGNVEVRRCGIEALGWARFTEEAGLTLIDECADPGNPGQRLSLHSVPGKVWGTPARVLICVNGSVDLDGGRHTFGLLVPPTVPSALSAAAWGYGLTAEEYAQLQRRA